MSVMISRIQGLLLPIVMILAIVPGVVRGQSPAASPIAELPDGPLGEQISWLLDALNAESGTVTEDEIADHFSEEVLAQVPADQMALVLEQLRDQLGPSFAELDSMVTTRDFPPTNARFVLVGDTGLRLLVSISIDRESGLITGLFFEPAPDPEASPVASPVTDGTVTDEEITFQSGPDTIYGSYMSPTSATDPGSAALIVSGSGPTDRNGNQGSLSAMNTNLNLATTLAANGIPSLRYDKLGSGETGFGSHAPDEAVGFELFLQEARDAVAFLASQPNADPGQLILVGHSEGALFALVLAQEMVDAGTPPAAVLLVSPLGIRYLDLLVEQVTVQYEAAVAAGQVGLDEADASVTELAAIVESLRATGELPATIDNPVLRQLFPDSSIRFLVEADAIDPADVAAALPPDLPVLVLRGEKDQQVFENHIDHLMTGFADAGNNAVTRVDLPDANHLLKVIDGEPNAALDYANPDLPFSPDAVAAIGAFLEQHGLQG